MSGKQVPFREKPSLKGEMVRKLMLLAALSVVATLAFAPAALAQTPYVPVGSNSDRCSGAAENLEAETGNQYPVSYFTFVPDVGGCVIFEGSYGLQGPARALNLTVYDPETGEELGLVKNLDPDLTSGANSTNYQEFCGAFPAGLGEPLTAQQYFEQTANAKEQAILDPNGDGLACTAEDATFLTGETPTEQPAPTTTPDTSAAPNTPDTSAAPNTQETTGTDGNGGMGVLPDTGGPALLLPVAGLLLASGLLGLFVTTRRRT